jgi:hypothetical protein
MCKLPWLTEPEDMPLTAPSTKTVDETYHGRVIPVGDLFLNLFSSQKKNQKDKRREFFMDEDESHQFRVTL